MISRAFLQPTGWMYHTPALKDYNIKTAMNLTDITKKEPIWDKLYIRANEIIWDKSFFLVQIYFQIRYCFKHTVKRKYNYCGHEENIFRWSIIRTVHHYYWFHFCENRKIILSHSFEVIYAHVTTFKENKCQHTTYHWF